MRAVVGRHHDEAARAVHGLLRPGDVVDLRVGGELDERGAWPRLEIGSVEARVLIHDRAATPVRAVRSGLRREQVELAVVRIQDDERAALTLPGRAERAALPAPGT